MSVGGESGWDVRVPVVHLTWVGEGWGSCGGQCGGLWLGGQIMACANSLIVGAFVCTGIRGMVLVCN